VWLCLKTNPARLMPRFVSLEHQNTLFVLLQSCCKDTVLLQSCCKDTLMLLPVVSAPLL